MKKDQNRKIKIQDKKTKIDKKDSKILQLNSNSEEKAPAKTKKVLSFGKACIAILVIILVSIVLARYVTDEDFRNFVDTRILKKEVSSEILNKIDIDSENNPTIYAFDKYITVLSRSQLKIYGKSGKQVASLEVNISSPIMDSKGKYLVIGEKNGSKLYLVEDSNIVWQTEIEKALASMDLLCAILTPNFYQSRWCDQEVGIALGRAIPTLSIKRGADPHGFIGKYQAIKAKKTAEDVAKDVVETICKMDNVNEKYFSILGRLFTNSKNEEEALDWLKQINKISNFSVDVIDKMASSFGNNLVLNTKEIVDEYNKLAKRFGRTDIYLDSTGIDYNIPF